jgi:micrococcal nuclease
MNNDQSKEFWINLFRFDNKNLLQKIIYIIIVVALIPYLWWAMLLALSVLGIKNQAKIKSYLTNNKKRLIKTSIYTAVGFVALCVSLVWISNAYGALIVSELPKLTNQKKLTISGTSSYKNGTLTAKLNGTELKLPITAEGKYSSVIELKEGSNTLLLEPVDIKGKQGFSQTKALTLDSIAPSKPVLKNATDKTTDESIELEVTSNEDGKVEVLRDGLVKASAETNNKVAKVKLGLSEGENAFSIFALDKAGNKSTEANSFKIAREKKPEPAKPVEKKTELFTVQRVVDGDTIVLEGGKKVRYIGIDTPETVDPNKSVECFGKEASDKNKALVEGKKVRLEKDVSEVDKYDRLLRYIYLEDGTFVNLVLVKEGYAHSSTYPPDVKHQEEFTKAEKEAREGGKGLWSNTSCNGTTTQVKAPSTTTPTTSNKTTTPSTPAYVAPITSTPTTNTSTSGVVKMSTTGICHAPGTTYYAKTLNFTSYNTVEACLAAGGRLPLR